MSEIKKFTNRFVIDNGNLKIITHINTYICSLTLNRRWEWKYIDHKRSGVFRTYDDDILCIESEYSNDELNGYRKVYLPSGKLERTENYKNGLLHGEYIGYDSNGVIREIKTYGNGMILTLELYDDKGNRYR